MKNLIKYVSLGIGGLIVLLIIVVAIIAATFNPNDYKPYIVKMVQEKKQRTLHIDGDIKLTFWPKIGADLGKISLSEHNSEAQFAAMNSAKVSLAVLPLLKKELVVDTVYVDGVTANIVRHKDGTTNFDDLMNKDNEESEKIKFDIDGINVTNASVNLNDEMTDAKYSVNKFNLKTGHVALKRPFDIATDFELTASKPVINAKANIKGNFMADPDAKHFVAKDLDAVITGNLATAKNANIKLSGDVDVKPETMEFLVDSLKLAVSGNMNGAKLAGELNAPSLKILKDEISGKEALLTFSQDKAGETMQAKVTMADIKGSPQAFQSGGVKADISSKKGSDSMQANIVLADIKGSLKAVQSSGVSGTINMKQGARTVDGKFSSPFAGNIEQLIFDLPKLAGNLNIQDPALPNGAVKGDFALKVHADVKNQQVASDFNLNLDNTKLKGNVAVASFSKPNIKFNLNADTLDMNKLMGNKTVANNSKSDKSKPADLSALSQLLLDGHVTINQLIYDKYHLSGINFGIKADGSQLNISPFAVKFDETNIKGGFGISRFAKPIYHFDLDIDKLDADKYITKSEAKTPQTKADPNAPIDLSALKQINADGELRVGWLKLANVKSTNVRIKLQADDGVAQLAPFSANLYEGSMNGSLRVDARSTPNIAFKQNMTGITIGPLLVDAINNDMLDGKGTLNVDVTTQGNTVGALKKSLSGTAALNLADGAVKGIDIAGKYRELKSKINVLKTQSNVGADQKQKTDFSEMKASFNIKNGVAHNDDLTMKAPLFRLAGTGDIDIGNESLNYVAKPTLVKTLKGQEGADLNALDGLTIPVKVTGTFSAPKYGIDYSAVGAALAKSSLLDKVGGSKGEAVKDLLGGNKEDALKSLLGGKKKTDAPVTDGTGSAPPTTGAAPAAAEAKPESAEDKAKKKLNKLLGF
jgi:AsmA protein